MTKEIGRKGKESRKRLLDAATAVFAERGFHDAKVSDIVKRAGLTQPSFYLYFPSKEAIFAEIVDHFRSRLRELTQEARLEAGIEAKVVSERIYLAVEAVFRFLAEDPALTRVGFFLATESSQIKAELAAMIQENLQGEQQAGYFRSELEMQTVAECLIGIMERLTVSCLLPGLQAPNGMAQQVVDLLLHGMLTNGHPAEKKNLHKE